MNQLSENPEASMTLWLPLQQRQVNLEGQALPISKEENQAYWNALPKERQLRFSAYAPTSTQAIESLTELESRYTMLLKQFSEEPVLMSKYYCGFRLRPNIVYFYTLGVDTFSEYVQYRFQENRWIKQLLSP